MSHARTDSGQLVQAGYQCLLRGCMKVWTQPKPGSVVCPVCGHRYVKWLNYEIMFPGR